MTYVPRFQERRLLDLLKRFPVVCLTGPRQAGKSTLLKHIRQPHWDFINLDERGLLEVALRDPDLFLQNLKTPAIIDEAQKAPLLFHSIKAEVDRNPKRRFILSGSANFLLMEKITESLAGRAAIMELLPFSIGELLGTQPHFICELLEIKKVRDLQSLAGECKAQSLRSLYSAILWGGMPKIWELKKSNERREWFEAYRSTYIERDLRNLAQVGNLEDFQRFYQSLAYQTANLLNLSELSRELGVTVPTCKRYLGILRTSYQAFPLPPYHTNIRKRLVKTSKTYFYDTGIVSFLLRIQSEEELMEGGRLGALFETWILCEIQKILATLSVRPSLSFWRPHAGREVDLVIEEGERLIPMEFKHAIQLEPSDWWGLREMMETVKHRQIPFGIVWYRGRSAQLLTPQIMALPIEMLWS